MNQGTRYLKQAAEFIWSRELFDVRLKIRPEGIEIEYGVKHKIVSWVVINEANTNLLLFDIKRMVGWGEDNV